MNISCIALCPGNDKLGHLPSCAVLLQPTHARRIFSTIRRQHLVDPRRNVVTICLGVPLVEWGRDVAQEEIVGGGAGFECDREHTGAIATVSGMINSSIFSTSSPSDSST